MSADEIMDYYYDIIFGFEILCNIFVIYISFRNIIIECRNYFLDILKLFMNINFILICLLYIAKRIIDIIGNDHVRAEFYISYPLQNAFRINIFLTSLSYWILMTLIIRELRKLLSDVKFEKVKKRVKFYEIIVLFIINNMLPILLR